MTKNAHFTNGIESMDCFYSPAAKMFCILLNSSPYYFTSKAGFKEQAIAWRKKYGI